MRPALSEIVGLFFVALFIALGMCMEICAAISEVGLTRKNLRKDTWPIKIARAVLAIVIAFLSIS
jgi:uncharacterized membrane protein